MLLPSSASVTVTVAGWLCADVAAGAVGAGAGGLVVTGAAGRATTVADADACAVIGVAPLVVEVSSGSLELVSDRARVLDLRPTVLPPPHAPSAIGSSKD